MLDITSKKSVKAYLRSHKLVCLYSFIGASWEDSAEELLSHYDAFIWTTTLLGAHGTRWMLIGSTSS